MEHLLSIATISKIYEDVRTASYSEKSNALSEQQIIDTFLDSILTFKNILKTKTSKLKRLTAQYEKLSWYKNVNEEVLIKLNDLLAISKDLRTTLIRQYISYNGLRKKGIAKAEIIAFKYAIDNYTETYKDIEDVFFYLPHNKEISDITAELELL